MQLHDPLLLRITDRAESVFKILFFLYAAMTSNCITFGTALISAVMWPTFALGALLILNRVLHLRRYRTPYMWWLVALLGAGCVSVLINRQYDFKMNVVYMICWAFYFLLLYIQPDDRSVRDLHGEVRLFAWLYTAFTQIAVVVSIVMLFIGYSLHVTFEGGRLLGGFVDSRLYGMFIDPNAGATCAAVSCLLLTHATHVYRRVWQRILAVVCIFLDLFYIALSDSRTGRVVLLTAGSIYVLLYLLRRLRRHRTAPILALLGALIVGLSAFFAPALIKTGYNGCVRLWAENIDQSTDNPDSSDKDKQEIIDSMTVDRDYDLDADISNRRFSVWKSGLEIFAARPIFGTSYCGFTAFAREHLPETYIVNNDHIDMITFDNEPINVLVSTGLLGFVPLMIFALGILIFLIRFITVTPDEEYPWATAALAAVFGIAASALFRTAVFYYTSANAVLFWTLLGILAMISTKNKELLKQGDAYDA